MAKKGKKKSRKQYVESILLAAALVELIIRLIELAHQLLID